LIAGGKNPYNHTIISLKQHVQEYFKTLFLIVCIRFYSWIWTTRHLDKGLIIQCIETATHVSWHEIKAVFVEGFGLFWIIIYLVTVRSEFVNQWYN